jgi:hypothetical protein
VELYYPDYPNNSRAGWGYMMLTNVFPNEGNGIFTLHAKATDVEGNEVTLGTRTITCDNANAVKPFGTIDKPSQGGEASGNSFVNRGWVLTPQPNSIPTDGSTIDVYVDGVDIGNPTYNIYRPDVAALFPGYANSDGAGGFFNLDTTAYANGVHTIYWTATDSAGNTDGIGSRFFTIQNPGSSSSSSRGTRISIDSKDLDKMPFDSNAPIKIQKGYREEVESQPLYLDNKGASIIHIKELERVKIQLPGVIACYMVVGSEFRSLPLGSTLDVHTGTFYWLAGPGYNGLYHLTFVVRKQEGELYRKDIMVRIGPVVQ